MTFQQQSLMVFLLMKFKKKKKKTVTQISYEHTQSPKTVVGHELRNQVLTLRTMFKKTSPRQQLFADEGSNYRKLFQNLLEVTSATDAKK